MSKLAKIAKERYNVADEHLDLYRSFEDHILSDNKSRSAAVIREMLVDNDFNSQEEVDELFTLLDDYEKEKITEVEAPLDYSFEPPNEIMQSFGYNPDTNGRLIITRDGKRIEVDDNLDEVGPVTDDNHPAPGHPEYVEPANLQRLPKVVKPKPKPEVPSVPIIPTVELLAATEEEVFPPEDISLVSVYAHLPDIGSVEYEVENIIDTMYAVVLVFDPSRSKPSFYPKMTLRFVLEEQGGIREEVIYLGCLFQSMGKLHMCFMKANDHVSMALSAG